MEWMNKLKASDKMSTREKASDLRAGMRAESKEKKSVMKRAVLRGWLERMDVNLSSEVSQERYERVKQKTRQSNHLWVDQKVVQRVVL
jgi:hypothetical protein